MEVKFESKGDFKNAESWLKRIVTNSSASTLNTIAREGEKSLSANTPKVTGETAAAWRGIVSGNQISWVNNAHPEAGVNIAKLIDQGHGTGTGGYVQPKPYIRKSMDPVWKSAGDKIAKELTD